VPAAPRGLDPGADHRYTPPVPLAPLRRLLLALALCASLALAPAAAAQAPPLTGTPVLGASLLSAEQMAAWYASTGVVSRSPVPVPELAARFVEEGAAQGVRGDIAFAQAMLETGNLRYGGIVRPDDLNFSGLGACDSCPRGLAFPSAELGVRAQIQHLYAYAAPTADPLALARPLADIRFTLVRPYGRAPVWEAMGGGNWATDPLYAPKVLGVWRSMLAHAGVPEPPPRTVGLAPELRVLVAGDGAVRLAGWRARRAALAEGLLLLGPPTSTRPGRGGVCLVRWAGHGAAVLVAGGGAGCDPALARMRRAQLTGPGWRTARGLAPGDSLARMRALYPRAVRAGASWHLVRGREPGARRPVARLRAQVAAGAVRALWVAPSGG
jgi:hypothetical protein